MMRLVGTGDISNVETKRLEKGSVTNFTFESEGVRFRGAAWGEIGGQVREGRAFVEGKLAGREYQTNDNPPQTRRSLDLTVTTVELLGAPKPAAPADDLSF